MHLLLLLLQLLLLLLGCTGGPTGHNLAPYQAVDTPQLIHTDVAPNPNIAEVANTWVLCNAAELVDHILL